MTEYKKGWFDGFAVAWTMMTGETSFKLEERVNEILNGSGKVLDR
jgi:hypothetical protein